VGGTSVTSATDTSPGGPLAEPGRTSVWREPVTLVIVITTALALALRLYQLSRPGYLLGLTEYDDGPYFGSAVRLTHGVLPYRDFVLVQPPGITLLMMPAALLAKITGTAWGMAIGRLLTTLASVAGVVLLGLLVRHRGVFATLVACGILAVFPSSISAAHTVLVEAWLVLFCLLGAVAVFDRDRLAGRRRLIWGGVAFGFAGAVEPWAIVPVLVVIALCLPRVRRAAVFAAGVAAGFLVPVLPFAVLAPRRFYLSVFVAQIGHRASATPVSAWSRFRDMTGMTDITLVKHVVRQVVHIGLGEHLIVTVMVLLLTLLVVGGPVAVHLVTNRPLAPLDWFAAAATVLVIGMFFLPSQFHYHFSAFLAPFLGMAVALPLAGLLAARAAPAGWLPWAVTGVAVVVLVIFAAIQTQAESTVRPYLSPAGLAVGARAILPGSCVATDVQSILILSNRFTSDVPGCSQMVDGIGSDLALSGGLRPQTGAGGVAAVRAVWQQEFSHAGFVWLSSANARRIAWSPALRAYFTSHFTRAVRTGGDVLYRRQRSGG
jgi:hypothetical protein